MTDRGNITVGSGPKPGGTVQRLPEWLRRPPGSAAATESVKRRLRSCNLNTVCEEARCPNIAECFARQTAAFLILGDICTRGCRFCSIEKGIPILRENAFRDEAERVAKAAKELNLRHIVATSVTRDDLLDGGASGFVALVDSIRRTLPEAAIELLVPDFAGKEEPLLRVLEANPNVLNHNLETVPRLYPQVRPQADYQRSLCLLKRASLASTGVKVKTGIMVGLGETVEEVEALLGDARENGVQIITIGQYLQPTRRQLSVREYVAPQTFDHYRGVALALGFDTVLSGPLVRSSYHADQMLR